jgi:hypothetical protein
MEIFGNNSRNSKENISRVVTLSEIRDLVGGEVPVSNFRISVDKRFGEGKGADEIFIGETPGDAMRKLLSMCDNPLYVNGSCISYPMNGLNCYRLPFSSSPGLGKIPQEYEISYFTRNEAKPFSGRLVEEESERVKDAAGC